MTQRILVVCMGNICRSPTAEAVLRAKIAQRGLDVEVDSAGTIGFHQGEMPDHRARAAGEARGYSFEGMRARQIIDGDFEAFDLILAADNDNLRDLKRVCPTHLHRKLALFLEYGRQDVAEIPDPYYGGQRGFDYVLDLVEDAADGLLDRL
ncbi:low molecular weight phosphotyrosine protein phosphatase [Photobacterium gaetbulicola]|uniref:protein-tyrosine-phosphatase n=2 Tax=Photobacterium gaetbulicola TaxID=1295392 RepID=A0A0C5WQ98_9GAMM|nr:low molecular weight protein-tyrosine-phosphatase [Photobacterium gaetbulicola]AJR09283.1 putative phosphotyrosine protein phosphatase [Photobacterium gaetbulicola Gung47]KHT59497.1 protein tyrosine phosphatase [Photobacterium gaetbulicola]PSU04010.1 low molecular weight phosphotyrosine protein phosphatase [Photobacterium gaetbulicola]